MNSMTVEAADIQLINENVPARYAPSKAAKAEAMRNCPATFFAKRTQFLLAKEAALKTTRTCVRLMSR